jgi:hypothetical protein
MNVKERWTNEIDRAQSRTAARGTLHLHDKVDRI